jgi:hypothetical protein
MDGGIRAVKTTGAEERIKLKAITERQAGGDDPQREEELCHGPGLIPPIPEAM